MKLYLKIGLAVLFLSFSVIGMEKEISIFDSTGSVQAYIDTDDNSTIYLWSGKPVAYLDDGSIYGFNGKHLGWLNNKILYDNDGYIVGFLIGGLPISTQLEPLKGLKNLKPLNSLKELAPLKPLFSTEWSSVTKEFLLNGSGD